MFDYPFIAEKHRFILERSTMNNADVAKVATVAKLYESALEQLHADPSNHVKTTRKNPTFMYSRMLLPGEFVVSSCTDTETGIYVQLAGAKGAADPILTVGSKWALENVDGVGTIGTMMWSHNRKR